MSNNKLNNQVTTYIQFYSAASALSDDSQLFPNNWLEEDLLNAKGQIEAWHQMQEAVGFTTYDANGIEHPDATFDAFNHYAPVTVIDVIELFNKRALDAKNIKKQVKVIIQMQKFNRYVESNSNLHPEAPLNYEFFSYHFLKDYRLEKAFWNLTAKLGYKLNDFNNLVKDEGNYEYTVLNSNLFYTLYEDIVR